jgi:hypothetical protein
MGKRLEKQQPAVKRSSSSNSSSRLSDAAATAAATLYAARQLHSNLSASPVCSSWLVLTCMLDCSLLLQVQHKVTDAITSIDGELCFNIGVAAPLDANEADKMAW